jgi:hypothetical protein
MPPSPTGDKGSINASWLSKSSVLWICPPMTQPHHHEDHPQQQPSSPAPSPVSIPVPTVAGTGTAKQVAAMKPQEKVEGNARTAEKNLPHGSFLPDNARERCHRNVSPRPEPLFRSSRRDTGPAQAPASPVIRVGRCWFTTRPRRSKPKPGIESVRSPQVDKVLAEVSDTAVSFKRIGTESVDVNLQPDRGTEINLHMTLSNGQVEVAARLERGNFDSLNTHWIRPADNPWHNRGFASANWSIPRYNQNPEGNQNRNQSACSRRRMQQELGGQRQPSSGSARPRFPPTSQLPYRYVGHTTARPAAAGATNEHRALAAGKCGPKGYTMSLTTSISPATNRRVNNQLELVIVPRVCCPRRHSTNKTFSICWSRNCRIRTR